IYYVSDAQQQAQYVKMFKDSGLNAICCDTFIDPHFVSFIEYKLPQKVKFMRIDADVAGALKSDDDTEDSALCEIFKEAIADDTVTVKTQRLKNEGVPAVINVDEYMRRYTEMGQFYGMSDDKINKTLVVNTANPAVAKIKELDEERQKFVAKYVYSLALLSFKKLSPEELDSFVSDNMKLLGEFIK
ncbi:MAG: molecular chaperone HtpG, partial [Clostridia bacterium]|nr:molecular chaperone HtpG [Clostridia bacterium]